MVVQHRYTVCFYDDKYKQTIPRNISIQRGKRVQDLEKKIRDEPRYRELISSKDCDGPNLLKCTFLELDATVADVAAWVENNYQTEGTMMVSAASLVDYFPNGPKRKEEKKIDVVVILDSYIRAQTTKDLVALNRPVAYVQYSDQVTFTVGCDDTGDLVWYSVIHHNGYDEQWLLPQFIKDVVEMPRRTAVGDTESAADVLLQWLKNTSEACAGIYDGAQNADNLLSNEGNAIPYVSGYPEIFHYVHVFNYVMSQQVELANDAIVDVDDTRLNMHQTRYVVLEDFQTYWLRQVEGAQCTFGKQLPFPLIVKKANPPDPTTSYRYWPKPDVAFFKDNFPRFLVAVDQLDNKEDEFRLYAQMACALRIASAAQKVVGREDKNIFLMGAFFSTQWYIDRLFFYLDGEKTCFHVKRFRMDDARDLTAFLFEFYNYTRHVRDEDTFVNMGWDMEIITRQIEHEYAEILHTTKRSKSPAPPEDDTSRGSLSGSSTGPSKRNRNPAEMIIALQKSGFVVQNYFSSEFEPLDELPPHVVEARTTNGVKIVAKLPRRKTDELSLLRELSPQRSPHNHVIPLLDTVQSDLGPLIILPWATRLSTKSAPFLFRSGLKGKFVQLSHELVEGVAFLHRQKIAHLDIKPENLVYSFRSKCLYIIDFDIAMQCKDVDAMVELSCGTPGWSAPEIVHDDNEPLRAFRPIRADLWSCGKVLWFFAKIADEKDRDLVQLVDLLLASNPGRRPLLNEVVDEEPDFWTSGRLHRALESQARGSKAQRPTLEGSTTSKRARDDASDSEEEHFTSKVLRTGKAAD